MKLNYKYQMYSLNDMDREYRNGNTTKEEIEEYIKLWNETSGRFTMAILADGYIRTINKP